MTNRNRASPPGALDLNATCGAGRRIARCGWAQPPLSTYNTGLAARSGPVVLLPAKFLIHYLVAQFQALVADPRVSGRCHGRDLMARLPAAAALFCPGLITHLLNRGDGRVSGQPIDHGRSFCSEEEAENRTGKTTIRSAKKAFQ